MKFISAVACVTVLLGAPSRAGAWGYAEHQALGAAAYREACVDLGAAPPTSDETQLLRVACGADLSTAALALIAARYGQFTALAGDHFARPEDFGDIHAPDLAENLAHYVGLALENESHFLPSSMKQWRQHHQRAVAQALTARQLTGLARQAAFEDALGEQAFADHFLHDSFAAGHAGFARVASRPGIAGSFHDYFNTAGRMFVDGRGRTWVGYGDGQLDAPKNEYARGIAAAAARVSTRMFLRAFVTGQIDPEAELDLLARFPVGASALTRLDCDLGPDGVKDCEYEDRIEPTTVVQRSAQPAIELGVGYRGAIGRRGHVPLLGSVQLIRWGTSVGGRIEYLFGTVRSDGNRGQGILGLGLAVESPRLTRFPLPLAASLLAGATAMLVDVSHEAKGSVGGYFDAHIGPALTIDVNKGWSLCLTGGPAYAISRDQARSPDGMGWWWGASFARVVATRGGGTR